MTKIIILWLLMCGVVVWITNFIAPIAAASAHKVIAPVQRTKIVARVELLNAKIKARNGKTDASGIVLWLDAPGLSARAGRPRQKIDQRGKRFIPHLLVVERGTEVDFPNSDPFFHNVFSLFDGKRFDLGLYASGESRPVAFNREGISFIFCNIHPLMSAVVVALDTPYFAVSDQAGNIVLPEVPDGRYQLRVWHERATPQELAAQTRTVQIVAGNVLDLGVIRINEAGYLPQPHPNKHGQPYDNQRNQPVYKP